MDKLDVYLVQREASGTRRASPARHWDCVGSRPYQQYLREGIPFNQPIEAGSGIGSVRIVVLDETPAA